MTILSDVAPKTLSRGPIEMIYANIRPNLESGWLGCTCQVKGYYNTPYFLQAGVSQYEFNTLVFQPGNKSAVQAIVNRQSS